MRRRVYVATALVVLVVGIAVYLGSPFLAVEQLKDALQSGDRDRLEQVADFPAMRESLKSQVTAAMLANFKNDAGSDSGFGAGLALLFGPALVDRIIDSTVTPEGLSVLIEHGRMASPTETTTAPSDKPLSGARLGYRSDLDTFAVGMDQPDTPVLILKRHGFASWKVARIDLPKSLFESESPAPVADQPAPSPPPATATAPEPAPPAGPEPAGSEAEATPTSTPADAAGIASRYLAAWSNPQDPDGEGIRAFYAPVVIFYGRVVSADDLMKEKLVFARRWPSRTYIARPASSTAQCDSAGSCTVTGILDWPGPASPSRCAPRVALRHENDPSGRADLQLYRSFIPPPKAGFVFQGVTGRRETPQSGLRLERATLGSVGGCGLASDPGAHSAVPRPGTSTRGLWPDPSACSRSRT